MVSTASLVLTSLVVFPSNFYLIIVILTKSGREIGTYKFVMLAFSLSNTLHFVVDIIAIPGLHLHGSSWILYSQRFVGTDYPQIGVLTSLTLCVFLCIQLVLEAVHFVYRYIVICRREDWAFVFNYPYYFTWFILPVLVVVVYASILSLFITPNDKLNAYIRSSILDSYGVVLEKFPYVGGAYFYRVNGNVEWQWDFMIATGLLSLIQISLLSIMAFCGISLRRELKQLKMTSTATQRLQLQLFRAMVVQSIVPMILLYLPCATLFALPVFEVVIKSGANFIVHVVLLFPAVEPFVVLYFVTDYRRACIAHYNFIFNRNKIVAAQSVTQDAVTSMRTNH